MPKKPVLPSWIDASSPFKLKLEFIVSVQGDVKEIIPAVSSGNPEVDILATQYLRGWRFAPLAHGGNEEQKGSVILIFGEKE